MALVMALQLAGCGGGGGSSFSGSLSQPVAPSEPPRDTDIIPTDFIAAERIRETYSFVRHDPNVGQAGRGVRVDIVGMGMDTGHPAIAGRVGGMTVTTVSGRTQETDDGTMSAILVNGKFGKEVYGIAYEATVDFVCCAFPFEKQDIIDVATYLGDRSDAFIVVADTPVELLTYANDDMAKCEEEFVGRDALCNNAIITLLAPDTSVYSDAEVEQRVLKACDFPDYHSTYGRVCVFGTGMSGFHPNGHLTAWPDEAMFNEYFRMEDLVDSGTTPLTEADRLDLSRRMYARSGLSNLPGEDSRFNDNFIAVAPLLQPLIDAEDLLPEANACGDAYEHCISAPGIMPFSVCDSEPGTEICPFQSGNVATALVAGAAALLKSTYPHLTPAQVVRILLDSATGIGNRVPNRNTGVGKLNVRESLRPVGEKLNRAGETLRDSGIRLGPALDRSFSGSGATFGMLDSHGRVYLHRLAEVATTSRADSGRSLESLSASSGFLMDLDAESRLGLSGTGSLRGPGPQSAMSLDEATARAGLEGCELGCASHRVVMAGSLVPASSLMWMERFDSVGDTRFGLVAEAGVDGDSAISHTSGGIAVASSFGESMMRLEAGALDESETFMGSDFGGAFEVGSGKGRYLSARLGTKVGTVSFGADYTTGTVRPHGAKGSYVTAVDAASFNGYRLAAGGEGWGLHYTVPLAATGGGMLIESVGGYTGPDGDWSVIDTGLGVAIDGTSNSEDWSYRTDRHRIDFGAGERERRLGLTVSEPYGPWDILLAVEHVSNSPRNYFTGDEVRAVVELSLFGD